MCLRWNQKRAEHLLLQMQLDMQDVHTHKANIYVTAFKTANVQSLKRKTEPTARRHTLAHGATVENSNETATRR